MAPATTRETCRSLAGWHCVAPLQRYTPTPSRAPPLQPHHPVAALPCAHLRAVFLPPTCLQVKLFNQHDLYTKRNSHFSNEKMAEMRGYYDGLIKKYLPERLLF